jgi:hypothetical protein
MAYLDESVLRMPSEHLSGFARHRCGHMETTSTTGRAARPQERHETGLFRTDPVAVGHDVTMVPPLPGKPGDVRPSEVETVAQLAASLRQLRLRAGNPALREIERLGSRHGRALPRSTVAGVLAGRHKPRRDLLLDLIEVLGVPEDDFADWVAAWEKVMTEPPGEEPPDPGNDAAEPLPPQAGSEIWRFPSDESVIITCGRLPEHSRNQASVDDPRDPDHVELLSYTDPDALLNLYGHLRAVNPTLEVRFSTTAELHPSDYSDHLVVLGGPDFNVLTRDMLATLRLPIRMPLRSPESDWIGFEITHEGETFTFTPSLDSVYGSETLHEDVILFFRGVNPVNRQRTVTICAGVFARGTLAAVQCLTDPVLGSKNQAYLRHRFAGNRHFGFIARAFVINGMVAPPDLTIPEHRLYEWARPE